LLGLWVYWFASLLGLWVCCDGGFVGFFYGGLWLIIGGLLWWVCTLQWISEFFLFFFFSFYVAPNTVKYFSDYFPVQPNTGKKIIFLEIIYICKHFMVENDLQRNKWSLNEYDNFFRNSRRNIEEEEFWRHSLGFSS
jgi:hypothetical protein